MTTSAFLNKSESAHFLHQLYEDYISVNKISDIHPNFYSLINENLRNPVSMSAIKKGYPRGNKFTYGKIDYLRILSRPMFNKLTLEVWFYLHYVTVLLAKVAA
jgi:hypothetical protein